MFRRLFQMLVFAASFAAFFACHHEVRSSAVPSTPPPRDGGPTSAERIPIGSDDVVRGNTLAYVTLVVFSDFVSSGCKSAVPVIDKVRDAYPVDILRVVYKNAPSPNAPQAKFAATVGQGVHASRGIVGFLKYRELAAKETQTPIGPAQIRQWALGAGLTPQELDRGLEAGAWAEKVEKDIALARRVGVAEPPMSFVNGVALSASASPEALKSAVEVELAKAKSLEESGVARADIYERAVAANLFAPGGSREDNELLDPKAVWRVPLGSSPVRGKPTALVTIVAFSAFDCPTCQKTAQALEKISSSFSSRVRVVWKDGPPPSHMRVHPSVYLARAARAQKGDTGFWDMHDRIFAREHLEDSDLEMLTRAAELDPKVILPMVKAQSSKRDVEADQELAEDLEITVSPQLFVNGRRLIGEQTYERLAQMTEEEIKKAEGILRSGIEPTALYDWFIKDGQPSEPVRKNVPIGPYSPWKGAGSGPVVIQVFSDFQCGPCRRADTYLEEVVKQNPGVVKVVWRDLPMSQHLAEPIAAEAAREAFVQKGTEGFWRMHDRLNATPTTLTREDVETHAKAIGLDIDKLRKALDNHVHKIAIEFDERTAAENGIVSTPTLVIGPWVIAGGSNGPRVKKLVNGQISEAPRAPVANGGGGGRDTPRPIPGAGSKFNVVDLAVGRGAEAKAGDEVAIHYRARLLDGTEVESTYRRGPHSFRLGSGSAIAGWNRAIPGMRVGGKRRATIPPELAFGNHGMGKAIPPNAVLVFDIELVRVGSE